MRRTMTAWVLALILAAAACSANDATANVGNMDAGATQACAKVAQIQAAGGSAMPPTALREAAAEAYQAAQASANPIIKARAAALFTDAAQASMVGEAPGLDQDLAAMGQLCSAGGSS
jgi:hypothetical protein